MWRYWIPNGLLVLRLIAGLVYPFVDTDWRVALLVYAAISDLIDGTIARWLNATSMFGQMLDPVADKICVLAVLFTAYFEAVIQWWELLGVAARDITVIGIAFIVVVINHRKLKEMPPRISGKIATGGQFAFLLMAVIFEWKQLWLTIPAIGLSVWAAIDYSNVAVREAENHRIENNSQKTNPP